MSFGRCLGLLMRRLRGEEGAGWGSGLLLTVRVGAIAQVGLFFSFFLFCLRLIDVVAFVDPFGAAGGAGTHQDFTKVPERLGGYYGDCGAW